MLYQLAEEVLVITSFNYTTHTFFTVNTFSKFQGMYTGYPQRRFVFKGRHYRKASVWSHYPCTTIVSVFFSIYAEMMMSLGWSTGGLA